MTDNRIITGNAETFSIYPEGDGYAIFKCGVHDGRTGVVAYRTIFREAVDWAHEYADQGHPGGVLS